ncbi:MAG: Zn-dependent hydrolase, partial [Brevibacterium aurantiacum]
MTQTPHPQTPDSKTPSSLNPAPSPATTRADLDDEFLADWSVHSRFGAVEGTNGVDRQAASAADGEQRKWFAELLEKHGFSVHRDAIG